GRRVAPRAGFRRRGAVPGVELGRWQAQREARDEGGSERVDDQPAGHGAGNGEPLREDRDDHEREHQGGEHGDADSRALAERLAEREAPVHGDQGNPQRHQDREERGAQRDAGDRELVACDVEARVEEVERNEKRRKHLDGVQHPVRRDGRQSLAKSLRRDPDDERAHEIIDAEPARDERGQHRGHEEKGELGLGGVGHHPRREDPEGYGKKEDESDEHRCGDREPAPRGGLEGDEQHRERDELARHRLGLDPEALARRDPERGQRVEDEPRGGGEQRQRDERRRAPWEPETGADGGGNGAERADPDYDMLDEHGRLAPQLAEIDLQPGEQEQRHDAQRREQADGGIVREQAEPQAGGDSQSDARDRTGEAVALEHARHHEQREQQQDVVECARGGRGRGHQRSGWAAACVARRSRRARVQLSAGGVAMVVTITMITTAEKTPASIIRSVPIRRVVPMLAKMSPTSPRGIIPMPTDSRSRPPPKAPRAHACLPRIAAAVSSAARPSTSARANAASSTRIPISTKKTGTSTAATGSTSSSSRCSPRSVKSRKCTSSRIRPAASAARTKQNTTAVVSNTPRPRSREAKRNSRGDTATPSASAPPKNASAVTRTFATPPTSSVVPRSAASMAPPTIARITSPSTSSITAAPRMTRASAERDLPRSLNTRAVMPTLVAVRVAPRNACA